MPLHTKSIALLFISLSSPLFAAPLNDTGQTRYGDGSSNTLSNEPDDYPLQDARIGRDAAALAGKLTKQGGGNGGFDFTKIASNGAELSASVTRHACVRDNVTGRTWEVKTNDNGLRDQRWTYTWYNSNSRTNGGNVGTANGGSCFDQSHCDTEKYAAQVNNIKLCGFNDWRLPKRQELLSIVDNSKINPSIDDNYFPNTAATWFWSSSPDAATTNFAWYVLFSNGFVNFDLEGNAYAVRLVRGGQ